MRNKLKTFEEYKYFKARDYVDDPRWHDCDKDGECVISKIPNEKDPNEPFFNINKRKYREDKFEKEKMISDMEEKLDNGEITRDEWIAFMRMIKNED